MTVWINSRGLDDAYPELLRAVLTRGERVAPRGVPTRELLAAQIALENPRNRYISLPPRRWSFAYALGEFCWHARGSKALADIAFYSERWRHISDDQITIRGSCYGAKIFLPRASVASQWRVAKELLERDPSTRRAILELSDQSPVVPWVTKDLSCACTLQFLVRSGKVEAIATMRSNDAILGFPYDVFLFSMLQEMMSVELGLEVGTYHHFVGSLHIYESQIDWAEEIAGSKPSIAESMPRMESVSDLEAFLALEARTRVPSFDVENCELQSRYWNSLFQVLRYSNAERQCNDSTTLAAVDVTLYRQLIGLRSVT